MTTSSNHPPSSKGNPAMPIISYTFDLDAIGRGLDLATIEADRARNFAEQAALRAADAHNNAALAREAFKALCAKLQEEGLLSA